MKIVEKLCGGFSAKAPIILIPTFIIIRMDGAFSPFSLQFVKFRVKVLKALALKVFPAFAFL